MKARLKKILLSTLLVAGITGSVGAAAIAGLKWRVESTARPLLTTLEEARPAPAALVFGAYVYPNGTPCPVLQDRLETALELYRSGKVKKLILSGDHGSAEYDEVNAMRAYLESRGVSKSDLFLDHAGFDTYDSVYRANAIFKAGDLILVTQDFHLKRALYIGQNLGLKVQGVPADRREIAEIKSLRSRELVANVKAFLDVSRKRKPVFLGTQFSLDMDGQVTHD